MFQFMIEMQRQIVLIRHAETAWTVTGQHTGTTDLPLTEKGRKEAAALAQPLKKFSFEEVWCSPLKRAQETCELAGFTRGVATYPDLVEWNYGKYEGLTTREIHKESPHWDLFLHGAPEGEGVPDVTTRINRLLIRTQRVKGNIAIFSSGHFLRALAASWLKQPISLGSHLLLSPASLSILGYEHNVPSLLLWNDVCFVK